LQCFSNAEVVACGVTMMRTGASGLAMVLVMCAGTGRSAEAQSDETARVKRGTEVYREQKCQACHSIGGVGNKRAPLDGVGSRRSEDQIRKWIVTPREMDPKVRKPAYDKLPKADVDALVAYVKTLRRQAGAT
jgi:mono/diheme cytochrome c family protein